MRLVVFASGAPFAEIVSDDEAVFIGGRDTCGLHLEAEGLPDQVAVVLPEPHGVWALQRLAEQEPVNLNGQPVSEKLALRTGDEIRIRDYEIRAELEFREARETVGAAKTSVAQMARFVQFQLPPGSSIKKSDDQLSISQPHLFRMAKVNLALASVETPEALMNIALQALQETFAAHRVWIGIRRVNYGPMEYVEGRLITGQTAELPETGESLKPRVLDRGQNVLITQGIPDAMSLIAGPLVGPDGMLGMVYMDSGDSGRRFDANDLDYFIALLSVISVQLDAIFKAIAKTRAATLAGEVVVTHAIQSRLTPRKLPQWENQLVFAAFREPGRERTTDVYDIVKLANGWAAFMIAHTSASGPLPAMLMAQTQSAFRSAVMHMDRPSVYLRSMNVLLYDGLGDRPLHCFMGVIDPANGQMRYAQAGHIGAYIIGQRGDDRSLAPPEDLPPLGMVKSANYEDGTATIDNEESLVLYTPGVVTARNSKGEPFGEDRFLNILCDGFGQLASTMLKEMLSDLQQFTEGGSQPEDITVILAHRN